MSGGRPTFELHVPAAEACSAVFDIVTTSAMLSYSAIVDLERAEGRAGALSHAELCSLVRSRLDSTMTVLKVRDLIRSEVMRFFDEFSAPYMSGNPVAPLKRPHLSLVPNDQ